MTMNALVTLLNRFGDVALQFAGGMLWQASLVIGVVFLLDHVLRNRARAALRYALWLLVLVKLLLPPSLALPTGIGYWIQVAKAEQPPPSAPPRTTVLTSTAHEMPPVQPLTPPLAPAPTVRREGSLVAVWISGALLLLGWLLCRSWHLARLVAGSKPASSELQAIANSCALDLRVAKHIPVRVSDRIGSPAVCGLWTPVMVLPQGLTGRLSGDQLRPVLLHELLHVKRYDVWFNCLQALLQVCYWWHPLVWFANARIRHVREEAVDEGVMVALGDHAEAYPATLLEVAKGALCRPVAALGLVGIFESKSALQSRIRRLLDRPVPRSARLDLVGLGVVLTVGALVLPMARGASAAVPEDKEPGQSVFLDCRILEISEAGITRLTLGTPTLSLPGSQRVWIYNDGQRSELLLALGEEPEAMIIARPRMVTSAGTTATFSVTQTTNINGKSVALGPVCEATPLVSGTNVDLTLKATVGTLEPSAPGGHVDRLLADVRVSIPDKGAALILKAGVRGFGGSPLAFVVTPQLEWQFSEDAAPKISAPPTETASVSEDVDPVPGLGVRAAAADSEAVPSSDKQVTRTYRLKLPYARNNLPKQFGSVDLSLGEALRRFLTESGVALEPSANFETLESPALLTPNDDLIASASQNFRATVSELMLTFRATPEHHSRIWSALETLNRAPTQITLEAKFIKVPRMLASMFNVGAQLPVKNATGKVRMLDEAQTRSLLRTLEATSGVDVVTAPRTLTLSDRQTQVKVVDVRSIVSAVNTSGEGPQFATEPMELGPSLDLIPTADLADGTIELVAIFQLHEFLGYAPDKASSGPDFSFRESDLKMQIDDTAPAYTHAVFRDQRASAKARIYDHYTLLLTEPQVSVTAKRLSTGDTSPIALPNGEQGYLVVLISPTMVDPAGNPLTTSEPRKGVPPQPERGQR
jgi:beta-lactamase regulating signal transducer with metallopeptidase domain